MMAAVVSATEVSAKSPEQVTVAVDATPEPVVHYKTVFTLNWFATLSLIFEIVYVAGPFTITRVEQ